jgi:uncharacterized protein (TIGR02145 family)
MQLKNVLCKFVVECVIQMYFRSYSENRFLMKFRNSFNSTLFFAIMVVTVFIFSNCQKEDNNSIFISGTVKDIDNNSYKTVTIGSQTWMAENLKVSRYRNGDPIYYDTNGWTSFYSGTAAYCYYNDDTLNNSTYGKLYNWLAISDSNHPVCPAGWHIPGDAEWTTLSNYLTDSAAGSKMKESGTLHWNSPNTEATNISGFTALPGGLREEMGAFGDFGNTGYWWSSTKVVSFSISDQNQNNNFTGGPPDPPDPKGSALAISRSLHHNLKGITASGSSVFNGLSVRCVKD